jgi:hypothetical protein
MTSEGVAGESTAATPRQRRCAPYHDSAWRRSTGKEPSTWLRAERPRRNAARHGIGANHPDVTRPRGDSAASSDQGLEPFPTGGRARACFYWNRTFEAADTLGSTARLPGCRSGALLRAQVELPSTAGVQSFGSPTAHGSGRTSRRARAATTQGGTRESPAGEGEKMLFREVTPALGTMERGCGSKKSHKSHKSRCHSRRSRRSCRSHRSRRPCR